MRVLRTSAVALACLMIMAPAAEATFPGANGRIAFSAALDGPYFPGIWSMEPDGSDQVPLTEAKPGRDASWSHGFGPSWFADGRRIIYSCSTAIYDRRTCIVDAEGSVRYPVGSFTEAPSLSPPGNRIVFSEDVNDYFGTEIFKSRLDGSGRERLTRSFDDNLDPVWSPNQQKIAFVRERDGSPEIFVMNLDGAFQRRLTRGGGWDPSWSADGTRLIYIRSGTGHADIYTVNVDGTGETRLTDTDAYEMDPAWSPDGAKITFGAGDGVYVMDADGANLQRITSLPAAGQPDWQPLLDPLRIDTRAYAPPARRSGVIRIPYTSFDGTGVGLAAVELWARPPGATSFERVLVDASPSGNDSADHFAYEVGAGEGAYSFYTVGVRRSGEREVSPSVPDTTTTIDTVAPTSVAHSPSVSRTGSFEVTWDVQQGGGSPLQDVELWVDPPGAGTPERIAGDNSLAGGSFDYVAGPRDGAYSFHTVAKDDAGNIEATPARPDATTVVARSPQSANDGTIVFTRGPERGSDIYSVRPDGTRLSRLTDDPGPDYTPALSPDGRRIVFASDRGDGTGVYVMNADGTGERALIDREGWDSSPAWSPDGAQIVFAGSSNTRRSGLWIVGADGSGLRLLTEPGISNQGDSLPSWSPDGQWIAFNRGFDEDYEVWVVHPDGTGLKKVNAPFNSIAPEWSPDGDNLMAFKPGYGYEGIRVDTRLYLLDPEGGEPAQLGADDEFDQYYPVWSPDGTRIAFGYGDLYVMRAVGTGVEEILEDGSNPDWVLGANRQPRCDGVGASPRTLWPPDHDLVGMSLTGAVDPDGDGLRLEITGITQDEPVGSAPDALLGPGSNQASLRAERSGDGRVYRIGFQAIDEWGLSCSGIARVTVPKSKKLDARDSGASYDSTKR